LNGQATTAEIEDRIEAEDLARARWYGFFARWFLAPPDEEAFRLVASANGPADAPHGELADAWESFRAAVLATTPEALRLAYDDTFISTGNAPVSLHASVYLSGFANEWPLVEARRWLAGLGIEASGGGLHTEDHLGLLCEVMAWLIVERDARAPEADPAQGTAARPNALGQPPQQFLFRRFFAPVYESFARRLADAPDASAYRELGRVFEAFMAIERLAFEIDD
jgi:TorA maturation chaperone TorD